MKRTHISEVRPPPEYFNGELQIADDGTLYDPSNFNDPDSDDLVPVVDGWLRPDLKTRPA